MSVFVCVAYDHDQLVGEAVEYACVSVYIRTFSENCADPRTAPGSPSQLLSGNIKCKL